MCESWIDILTLCPELDIWILEAKLLMIHGIGICPTYVALFPQNVLEKGTVQKWRNVTKKPIASLMYDLSINDTASTYTIDKEMVFVHDFSYKNIQITNMISQGVSVSHPFTGSCLTL